MPINIPGPLLPEGFHNDSLQRVELNRPHATVWTSEGKRGRLTVAHFVAVKVAKILSDKKIHDKIYQEALSHPVQNFFFEKRLVNVKIDKNGDIKIYTRGDSEFEQTCDHDYKEFGYIGFEDGTKPTNSKGTFRLDSTIILDDGKQVLEYMHFMGIKKLMNGAIDQPRFSEYHWSEYPFGGIF